MIDRILDIALIVFCCWAIGYCIEILRLYWRDKRAKHIAALAFSYCGLTLTCLYGALDGCMGTVRQCLTLLAIASGDYGVWWLWRSHWKARREVPRRRSGD